MIAMSTCLSISLTTFGCTPVAQQQGRRRVAQIVEAHGGQPRFTVAFELSPGIFADRLKDSEGRF